MIESGDNKDRNRMVSNHNQNTGSKEFNDFQDNSHLKHGINHYNTEKSNNHMLINSDSQSALAAAKMNSAEDTRANGGAGDVIGNAAN